MNEYQKDANPGAMRYRGICSICENAPTCIFPRDPNRLLLHCDELELSGAAPKTRQTATISPSVAVMENPREETKGSNSYLGLCRLCERRETCTFPKPEGGVWHCEEYE